MKKTYKNLLTGEILELEEIPEPQESELEAAIRQWLKDNNNQYPSAGAWKEAMIKGVAKIAREKIVDEVLETFHKKMDILKDFGCYITPGEIKQLEYAIENLKGGDAEG